MPLTESQARFRHRDLLRAAHLPIPAELLEPTESERERMEKDRVRTGEGK